MHEENRFFRILWRFNAIALALAGILVIVLLAGMARELLFAGFGSRDQAVPVKATAVDKIHFDFGASGAPLTGTAFVLFTLQKVRDSDATHGISSGSLSGRYNPSQDANYMAVDAGAATGAWLFPGETQAIWDRTDIYRTPSGDGGDMVTALVLRVADADTNKDGALSGDDRPSLYYYRLGEARAVKFFSADAIASVRQIDSARLSVIFSAGGRWNAAVFSTGDFHKLAQGVLPRIPD